MSSSFAYFRAALYVPVLAGSVLLAGCASLPPPTAELAAAEQAVLRAESADADQYAAAALAEARTALQTAQAAMARSKDDDARAAALAAADAADLARVRSEAARTGAEYRQRQDELKALRAKLGMGAEPAAADPLSIPVPEGAAEQRMQALDADMRLNPFAQLERMQARQALAALPTVPRRALPAALARAARRVEIAEQAARVEATRRQVDELERARSELLVEASRRDAERARAEAEHLRLQAQVQAEENRRLQIAEQQAAVAAAREKEAELARQEAELEAGAKLPPMQRDARGEVFTLAGSAFPSGQARLTGSAAASIKALGLYLAALPGGAVQVIGHTDSQGDPARNRALSEQRAQQVRATLVQAGLPRERVTATGRGADSPIADNATAEGRARNRRVDIIVDASP